MVSPQSRLQYSHAVSIQIVSHVNKCTYICISYQSMERLTSIQVLKYPQIHPVTISNTSRFEDVQLTSTQVLSHLHLSPYFTHVPSQASIQVQVQISISLSSRLRQNSIKFTTFMSHLYLGHVSPRKKNRVISYIHPGHDN